MNWQILTPDWWFILPWQFATEGLWSMLCLIPGLRGEGSDLPSYHQTTKVTLTESSPERSWYMHIDKQVTLSILIMLFSLRGTETAKVDGLLLANRPKHLVPKHPDDNPEVWSCSPFKVPSLYSMRDPHDIISWHHDHLLWSSSRKTTAHVHWNCHGSYAYLLASTPEPQILWKLQTSLSLS